MFEILSVGSDFLREELDLALECQGLSLLKVQDRGLDVDDFLENLLKLVGDLVYSRNVVLLFVLLFISLVLEILVLS